MAFATLEDVKNAISRDTLKVLTDDFDTDTIAQDAVSDSISKAEGYLKTVIPSEIFTETFVKPIEIELAAYFLYMRLDYRDYAEARWDTVKSMLSTMLRSLKAGVASQGRQSAVVFSRPKEFTEDLMRDW